jgi:hypothetical protein
MYWFKSNTPPRTKNTKTPNPYAPLQPLRRHFGSRSGAATECGAVKNEG